MDLKKLVQALLFPPVWLLLLLSLLSAAALVAVFLFGYENTVAAYCAYVLAFYTLSVVCLFCWKVLPGKYRQYKKALTEHKLIGKLYTDQALRTQLTLYLSLMISLIYVGLNLLNWYWSRSWWFVVLAGYYVIMAVMRFLLVRYMRKHSIGADITSEWKRSRLCACVLLLVNLSLSGAVLMILYQHKGYQYPGIMIYTMALYTFYAMVHAIIEIVRHRSVASPVMTTAKIVSLSAALVSMLNLETAMFAQFGKDMAPEHQRIFIILTGAGISLTVVTLSVLLIVSANINIRRIQHGK